MKDNKKFVRGLVLGLSIVAVAAAITAGIIGYVKKGEINFSLLGIISIVMLANFVVFSGTKDKPAE